MSIIERPPVVVEISPGEHISSARPSGRRRRAALITFIIGAVVVLSSVVWRTAAVPALVKYPTDLDVSLSYAGTFRLFADPDTFAPLDEPMAVPLTVERRLVADGAESGASRVVVDETLELTAGTLLNVTQRNAYVMDRRDSVNVADDRAFTFDPANVVDRSGAYRLQFPFGTDENATYALYITETDSTSGLVGTGETYDREGLTLNTYTVNAPYAPLSVAYLAEIRNAVPLPESLTFDELKPYLLRAGLDVNALIAALTPVVSAGDLQAMVAATAEPVRLEYVQSSSGTVGIDRRTGSEVDVSAVHQTVAVRPAQSQVAPLLELLEKYSDVPLIEAATDVLAGLATNPLPVAQYDYAQTAASVADTAAEVKDQRGQMDLVDSGIPVALTAVGTAILAVGAVIGFVPRRRGST